MLSRNDRGNVYDKFRNRIMFPIRDKRGRTVAFGGRVLTDEKPKYLNSPETITYHKGNELHGLYEALQINDEPENYWWLKATWMVGISAIWSIMQWLLFRHQRPRTNSIIVPFNRAKSFAAMMVIERVEMCRLACA